MEGFDPVTLIWKGEEFTVEPDRVMGLILIVEDALTAGTGEQALSVLTRNTGPQKGRLCKTYTAALRYAGAKVTEAEVYKSLIAGLANNDKKLLDQMQSATIALFAILAPPVALAMTDGAPKKKERMAKKSEP